MTRLLILGGTGEAVALAEAVARELPDWDVVTSLAGVTTSPVKGPGRMREGGFGGAAGLAAYLKDESIDLLVDATHPFAATMARNAEQAARESGVPRIKLVRPMWARRAEDRWVEVDNPQAAAQALTELGARSVFLTLGRRDLDAFAGLADTRFVVRMIEPPEEPLPLEVVELLLARGPFTTGDEIALMRDHGIDAVVSKASGGSATQAKILAARDLGIPVVMVSRPPMPDGDQACSLDDALAWLKSAPLQR
jgi:precorrin-6A/cobalt-precorrin-6A reductase